MKLPLTLSFCLALTYSQITWAEQTFPQITTPGDTTWYALSTPERNNLHLSWNGSGALITGKTADYSDSQLWCFIPTKDGHYNMLNRAQNEYFEEKLPQGQSYYKTTSTAPETGIRLHFVTSKNLYNLIDAAGENINQCDNTQDFKITTWTQGGELDKGNLFHIEEIDPANIPLILARNEARTLLQQTEEGDAPGTYSKETRAQLEQAIQAATTSEELLAAMDVYKKSINWVKEGQLYFLVSTGPGYCNNRVMYNTKPTEGAYLRWGDKTIDENALWEFIKDGDTENYLLKNKATGLYLHATSNGNDAGEVRAMQTTGSNSAFKIEPLGQNKSFLLYTPGGNPIHAQNDFGIMVTWNSRNYGSASSWQIIPATENETKQAADKTISDNKDYKIVWQEEFNTDGPVNDNDWNFEYGFVRNNEDQWYQKENASIKNGNLVIEAKKERKDNPWYEEGSSDWKKSRKYIDYTSTCMTTANKHDFLYGRVEVRAKIPCYQGSWPAIWLLGYEHIAGEWPSSGEIDMMEYYKDKTLANLVWGSPVRWQGIWEARSTPVSGYWQKQDKDWAEKYHIWRMDWDKESIKLYLDDELITICNLNRTINQGEWHKAENPFHTPQYLLLNLAIGGNNARPIDDSKFPYSYLVDYVRVYQKSDDPTGIGNVNDNKRPLINIGKYSSNINTSCFEGEVQAVVYNLSGRIVATSKGLAEKASLPINTRHLSHGVYMVRISDRYHSVTEKILIP